MSAPSRRLRLPDGRVVTSYSQRRYVLIRHLGSKAVIVRRSDSLGTLLRIRTQRGDGDFIYDTMTGEQIK